MTEPWCSCGTEFAGAVGVGLRPATVVISSGRISAIVDHGEAPPGTSRIWRSGRCRRSSIPMCTSTTPGERIGRVSPPPRRRLAGGVAAIIDMPLNSIPPTTTLPLSRDETQQRTIGNPLSSDVGFWEASSRAISTRWSVARRCRRTRVQSFLVESGVDEFQAIGFDDLDVALTATAAVGLPLLVHAESPAVIAAAPATGADYRSYLASRPPEAEVDAIAAVIEATRRTGGRSHILHLSAADALPSSPRRSPQG